VDPVDDDGDVTDSLLSLELRGDPLQLRVGEAVCAEEIRIDEREQKREPHERGCSGDPPPAAKPAREPHDDGEREAEEDEPAGEREPVAEHERRVADA